MIDAAITAIFNGIWQTLALYLLTAALLRVVRLNAASCYVVWLSCFACSLATTCASPMVHLNAHAISIPRAAGIILVGFAATAIMIMMVRVAIAYSSLARYAHHATILNDDAFERLMLRAVGRHRRPSKIVQSPRLGFPAAVGYSRPTIIVPRDAVETLTAEELDQVVLHEFAHVERWDDWAKVMQRVLQAALCFEPAIHAICSELDFEREVACDDWVVTVSGKPKLYAQTLLQLAQTVPIIRPGVAALGFIATRGQVLKRVQQLSRADHDKSPRISSRARWCGVAVIVAAVAVLSSSVSVHATGGPRAMSTSCRNCNVSYGSWRGIAIQRADFSGSNLPDADFTSAVLRKARFESSNLIRASFRSADLRGANFHDANLSGADLRDANLRGANFYGARLHGARFSGAQLEGANLPQVNTR